MKVSVRLQLAARSLFYRDLLSAQFYVRRLRREGLIRGLAGLIHTKVPYLFPVLRLPYVLGIEPTTNCNLHCVMCPSPGFKSARGYMSMALFENILAQAAAARMHRIRFVGLGEPLLHPELPSMIRKAKQSGFYAEVSTNATLLTVTLGAALLDAGLDEIAFSLDSAHQSEFERIRKGASYAEVCGNIETFLAMCAERRRSAPITIVRMVIMEGSDVEAFSRRWSNRVDSLQFNQLRVYSNTGSAGSVRRGVIPAPSQTQIRRKVRCRQILHHLLIQWDGTVSLCNQAGLIVGDANTSSLEDIWRGYALQKVRSLHSKYKGCQISVCRACPVMAPSLDSQSVPLPTSVATRIPWSDDQVAV